MSDWKEVRLGDVLNFRRGYDLPKSSMENGNIPVAGSNGIIGWHNETTNISPLITIGRSGSVGHPNIYPKGWAHNTTLYIDDFKGNYPLFLYYLLFSLPLSESQAGSAVPTLNRNHIHPLTIKFPTSLAEQRKIAGILSALDDKIETNRRINARLEELAQALFKSWFIDFTPFGGQMPQDWEICSLDSLGEIVSGATPSKDNAAYWAESGKGIAWLTPKDLSETKAKFTSRGKDDITELGYKKSSTRLMPKGSILFSSRAPIGYITIALNDICTNQGFKSFVPKSVGTAYAYYLLQSLTTEIENKSTGSTFKEASGSLMKSLQVVKPNNGILTDFEKKIQPIFERQLFLESESARLAALRDTLLPKLMSGELKISD